MSGKVGAVKEKTYEIRPGQSEALLKELHILTRDGKMNQDSRRKLKQVYHLYQFIEPLLKEAATHGVATPRGGGVRLVDHGAGKSYLGFILYDLFFKDLSDGSCIYGIETREELVQKSRALATRFGFGNMSFFDLSIADATASASIPAEVDVVTALHACDTATDDAIRFALDRRAQFIVLVPCCQAEAAAALKRGRSRAMAQGALSELWRHPIHTREFGSHVTNVLRCLQLEASGYLVNVTELVGWEHAMKNELIIARRSEQPNPRAAARLQELIDTLGLEELAARFSPDN